jgi:DNA-directed RNA polymerase specialized sigma subunit
MDGYIKLTAKEYMKEAKILLKRIERKRREAESIRICESSPSSPAFSDMPKTATHNPHRMSDSINRAIDLDREADAAFDELSALKSAFLGSLQKLDNPDERDLMYKRYIEFKSWNEVFHEMGYSKSAGYRVHSNALSKL